MIVKLVLKSNSSARTRPCLLAISAAVSLWPTTAVEILGHLADWLQKTGQSKQYYLHDLETFSATFGDFKISSTFGCDIK